MPTGPNWVTLNVPPELRREVKRTAAKLFPMPSGKGNESMAMRYLIVQGLERERERK